MFPDRKVAAEEIGHTKPGIIGVIFAVMKKGVSREIKMVFP
jgi:hypothetical protein